MRAGNPAAASAESPAAPNSASGRLLPVDVNPGTCQSLTVFHHLDRHGPQQLRLPLVQRCAMDHLAYGPHDALGLTGFEELDRSQRRLGVGEQPLEISDRRRGPRAPRWLEGPLLVAARQG